MAVGINRRAFRWTVSSIVVLWCATCSPFVLGAGEQQAIVAVGGMSGCHSPPAQGGMVSTHTPPPQLRIAQDEATVSIFDGDRPVVEYRYTNVPMKPYVKRLFSPGGVNVLRDAPHDHKHHHALMFAVAVDGIDFWAETDTCGRQKHRLLTELKTTSHDGLSRAAFTHELDWIDPASEQPLVSEQRTIEVCRGKDIAASLLTWQSRIRPAAGREPVTLTGSHYFGLGMRFVESMDQVGRFYNADGREGQIVRGEERLVRSRWCAYAAPADGRPVTVAIFDHPNNPRHPATMFTMPKGFAYLSATLNLWKEPMIVTANEPLELRYAVALWDGRVDQQQIEGLYRRWAAWSSANVEPATEQSRQSVASEPPP